MMVRTNKTCFLFSAFLVFSGCGELTSNSAVGTSIQSSCDEETIENGIGPNNVLVGDMILPIEAIPSDNLLKYWPEKASQVDESEISSLGASQNFLTTWENGIVPLSFAADVSAGLRANVLASCAILSTHANVSCVERTDEFFFVSVTTVNNGCFATVGRTRNGIINLQGGCDDPTVILHELMHVFGVMHEQQHPERDGVVRVIPENIANNQDSNFTLLNPGGVTTDFDVDSIMLYSSFAFAIDRNSPTLVRRSVVCDAIPTNGFPNECLIPYNSNFSTGDSGMIEALYGAAPVIPPPPVDPPVDPPTPDPETPVEPEICFLNQ